MADDPLAAALAEIRERSRWTSSAAGIAAPGATAVKSARDVPRLLAALEKALEFHEPHRLYGLLDSDPEDAPCSCGHDPEAGCHFEGDDGDWLCECRPERAVCATCYDASEERLDWPCGEYKAVARELLGEEAPYGRH